MNKEQQMVQEFHEKQGHAVDGEWDNSLIFLRDFLIREEGEEVTIALYERDEAKLAKELADLLYVTYGTAVSLGIDMEPVFKAVHESNMTKSVNKDKKGKTLKSDTYQPPDIEAVLAKG